jgi:hypothetical protein
MREYVSFHLPTRCESLQDLKNMSKPEHFKTYMLPGQHDPIIASDKLVYRSKEMTVSSFAKYMNITLLQFRQRLKKYKGNLDHMAVVLGADRWSCSTPTWRMLAVERYKNGGEISRKNKYRIKKEHIAPRPDQKYASPEEREKAKERRKKLRDMDRIAVALKAVEEGEKSTEEIAKIVGVHPSKCAEYLSVLRRLNIVKSGTMPASDKKRHWIRTWRKNPMKDVKKFVCIVCGLYPCECGQAEYI